MNAKTFYRYLIMLALLAFAPRPARAQADDLQPGDLDPTFSNDGKRLYIQDSLFSDLEIQPDGKVLAAGALADESDPHNTDILVLRYTTGGTLDTSFSSDGRIRSTFSLTGREYPAQILLQPDGKIVVVAEVTLNDVTSIGLVRYHADGSLDTSFAGNGKAFIPPVDEYLAVHAAANGPNGSIYVAGHYLTEDGAGNIESWLYVARLGSNGQLDASFGGQNGAPAGFILQRHSASDMHMAVVTAIVLAADGDPLLLGWEGDDEDRWAWMLAVNRHTGVWTDVTPAAAPAFACTVNPDPEARCDDWYEDAERQPDGKIVIVGSRKDESGTSMHVMRLNSNYTLDTAFDGESGGGNGYVRFTVDTVHHPGQDRLQAVDIQPDGKIVAAGSACTDPVIVRLLPNGAFDDAFGGEGVVFADIRGEDFSATHISAVQYHDGKIVVGADTVRSIPGELDRFRIGLARYIAGDVTPGPDPVPGSFTLNLPVLHHP